MGRVLFLDISSDPVRVFPLGVPMSQISPETEGARLSNWLADYSHDLMEEGDFDQEAAELNKAAQWIADHLALAQTPAVQTMSNEQSDAMLILANEYEVGLQKMVSSGYEEYGPDFQRHHRMVIDALRFHAAAALSDTSSSAGEAND